MKVGIQSALAAVALVLAGCASSGTMVTEQQQAQFQKGITTRAQVIEKLGAPEMTSKMDDGTIIDIYTHVHAAANAASYIPVVGLLAGGANATTDTVTFAYRPDRVLKSISSSRGHNTVHTGLLNQN